MALFFGGGVVPALLLKAWDANDFARGAAGRKIDVYLQPLISQYLTFLTGQ
jgi:hypothetical protein